VRGTRYDRDARDILSGWRPIWGRIAIAGIRLSRRSLWYLALVIPAVAVPCLLAVVLIPAAFAPEYGPDSGILTGIVAKCTLAQAKAAGETPDPSRGVTVSVLTMDGETPVVSQELPLTTAGVRYRMSLPAGTYWVYVQPWSDSNSAVEVPEYVPAGQSTEEDFSSDSDYGCE
jgi:hypothetical protein